MSEQKQKPYTDPHTRCDVIIPAIGVEVDLLVSKLQVGSNAIFNILSESKQNFKTLVGRLKFSCIHKRSTYRVIKLYFLVYISNLQKLPSWKIFALCAEEPSRFQLTLENCDAECAAFLQSIIDNIEQEQNLSIALVGEYNQCWERYDFHEPSANASPYMSRVQVRVC